MKLPGTPRIAKPTATAIYIALQGYVSKEGIYAAGTRLRGDHPAVIANPAFWAPEGLDDQESASLRRERFPSS